MYILTRHFMGYVSSGYNEFWVEKLCSKPKKLRRVWVGLTMVSYIAKCKKKKITILIQELSDGKDTSSIPIKNEEIP